MGLRWQASRPDLCPRAPIPPRQRGESGASRVTPCFGHVCNVPAPAEEAVGGGLQEGRSQTAASARADGGSEQDGFSLGSANDKYTSPSYNSRIHRLPFPLLVPITRAQPCHWPGNVANRSPNADQFIHRQHHPSSRETAGTAVVPDLSLECGMHVVSLTAQAQIRGKRKSSRRNSSSKQEIDKEKKKKKNSALLLVPGKCACSRGNISNNDKLILILDASLKASFSFAIFALVCWLISSARFARA